MTASAKVTIGLKVAELGVDDPNFVTIFTSTATPARAIKQILVQATADTEEVLPVGDVGAAELILIKCVSNDVDIDPSYTAATFRAGIEVQEGEWTVFKPSGTTYIKNNDAGESVTLEYWIIGTA